MSGVFDWFGLCEDLPPNPYPFRLRVVIPIHIPPRDPRFEMCRAMGSAWIDSIMNGRPVDLPVPSELTFIFPEHHLTIHEQQRFLTALAAHPDTGKVARVDIVTQSVQIIQTVPAESLVKVYPSDEETADE